MKQKEPMKKYITQLLLYLILIRFLCFILFYKKIKYLTVKLIYPIVMVTNDFVNFFINITNDMNINEEGYVQTYQFKFPDEHDNEYKLSKITITTHSNKYYEIDETLIYAHNVKSVNVDSDKQHDDSINKATNETIHEKYDDTTHCNELKEFIRNITKYHEYKEFT